MDKHGLDRIERVETPDRRFKTGVRVKHNLIRATTDEFLSYRDKCRTELGALGEVWSGELRQHNSSYVDWQLKRPDADGYISGTTELETKAYA
jgi:hypothetical protein